MTMSSDRMARQPDGEERRPRGRIAGRRRAQGRHKVSQEARPQLLAVPHSSWTSKNSG
jgi:hypothetical protein